MGHHCVAERKPVLRMEPVLVLRRGAAWHGEAVVGEHLAGTGDMGEDAIEYTSAVPVIVHAELEEVPQEKRPACETPKASVCATSGGS